MTSMAGMMNIMCLGFLFVLAVTSALPSNNAVAGTKEHRVKRARVTGEASCTLSCTTCGWFCISCSLSCSASVSFSSSARRRRTTDIEGMPNVANYTYEDLFAELDADCNGAIDACEWIERDSKLADFVSILENVDSDGDEMVSLEELKMFPGEGPEMIVDMYMKMPMDKYDEMMEIVDMADEQPGKGRKTDDDDA